MVAKKVVKYECHKRVRPIETECLHIQHPFQNKHQKSVNTLNIYGGCAFVFISHSRKYNIVKHEEGIYLKEAFVVGFYYILAYSGGWL